MLTVAIGLRDDRFLRHYKYTWALAGIALLIFTFLFGTEVNGARLWIYLGPIGFQPTEFIKIVLVLFIAGYLAEHRALLRDASLRLGPIRVPPLPYLLPMLAIFVLVMLVVIVGKDLGTALLFFGIFLTMLFVATGRRSYVLIGLLLFLAGSFVASRLFEHVARRVDAWLDPVRRSHRSGLPDGAGALRLRARRPLRRGAGPVAAADRRRPVLRSRDRLHLRGDRRGAGRDRGVRAAGADAGARLPRPAGGDPGPR